MVQYAIETRIVKLTGENDVKENTNGFGENRQTSSVQRQDFKVISRSVGNILADDNLTVGEIKSQLREKANCYKDAEIESQKFEANSVFENDLETIAPQPWLVYTITLKK